MVGFGGGGKEEEEMEEGGGFLIRLGFLWRLWRLRGG